MAVVDLICFRSTKYSLQEFLTFRIIISGGKCAVSEQEICLKVEKNEIRAEYADQKHINKLPLVQQFALTAVKLQMFGGKACHVWHPISLPRSRVLDVT